METAGLLERIQEELVAGGGFVNRGAQGISAADAPLQLLEQEGAERRFIFLLCPADGLTPQGARESLSVADRLLARAEQPTTVILVYATRQVSQGLFQLRQATNAGPGKPQALLVWLAEGSSGTLYAHPGWPMRMPPGHSSVTRGLKSWQREFGDPAAGRGTPLAEQPYLSYGFIGIYVLLYLAMEASGGSQNTEVLVAYGAQFNPLVEAGQYWRLVTHLFLHIGLAHLLFNGVTMLWMGPIIERLFGRPRFLFVYFFAGIGGGLATYFFYVDPVVSAGASGALFGFFGALAYHAWNQPRWSQTRATQLKVLLLIIGGNIIFGLVHPTVNNSAHMGGMIAGFLASAMVGTPEHRSRRDAVGAVFISMACISGGFYVRALLLG